MSHIVQIQTEIRDPVAIQAACRRLNLSEPAQGTTKLFSGEVTGLAVQLPGWKYPVVCDTHSGTIHFDNYEGRWGAQPELDKFIQTYSCEKVKIESRRQGHTCTEQLLADGSVKLTINAGGVI